MKLTPKKARRLVREWQRRLRLRDWIISVRLGSLNEAFAHVTTTRALQSATIVVDPRGEEKFNGRNRTAGSRSSYERAIVHELLHVRLAGKSLMDEEQAVHALSTALVGLKRRRKRG